MRPAVRNRLIIGAVVVVGAAIIAVEMFYSTTPPRHADHDHAIATLDAGGFLRVIGPDGAKRNLVGRPGKVLVLHWFDPIAKDDAEPRRAARWAATVATDPVVEVLFIAEAPSREGLDAWAEAAGVPTGQLYVDLDGKTGELFGVRRLPETLIYDPAGVMAFQARGPASWSGAGIGAQVERAKRGVDEVH